MKTLKASLALLLFFSASASQACVDWDQHIADARLAGDYQKAVQLVGAKMTLGGQCEYAPIPQSYAPIAQNYAKPARLVHKQERDSEAEPLDPVEARMALPGSFP